jgi:hypothetical protein
VRQHLFSDSIDWHISKFFDTLKRAEKPRVFFPSLVQHVGDVSTVTVWVSHLDVA